MANPGGPETPLTPQDVAYRRQASAPRGVTGYTDAERRSRLDQQMSLFTDPQMQQIMPNDGVGSVPQMGGQAIAQGQQMLDPNSVPAQQTQAGPQRNGGQNIRDGYNLSVQAPDYGRPIYNSDIVPHPDPRVVQHAGMAFSMPAFQIGAAAIGSRLQEQRNQQQQLEQAAQKLMGGATDDRAKVPAPYVRSYNKFADNAQNEFIQSLTAKYGSEKKAMEKMVSDPAIRRQWEQLNRDLNGTGEALAHGFSKSELFLNDVKNGHLVGDKASVQAAQEYQNGYMGRGGEGLADLRVLKEVSTNFEKQSEPVYYFKEMGLDAHLKDAFAKSYDNFRVERDGQMIFTKYDDIEQAGRQLDDIAERTHSQFENLYPTLEEWKEKIHNMYPMRVELKLNVQEKNNPPASSSAASQPKTIVGDVEVGLSANYPDNTPTKNPTPVYRVPIARVVDGRPEMMGKKDFKDGTGARMDLIPTHLALSDLDGKLYIEGENAGVDELDTEAKKLEMDIQSLNATISKYLGESDEKAAANAAEKRDAKIELLESKTKRKKDGRVPYNGNEKTFELFVGKEQAEDAKAKAYAAREADPMRKRSKPAGAAKPETVKVGTKRKDSKGQEWEKVEGGWKAL